MIGKIGAKPSATGAVKVAGIAAGLAKSAEAAAAKPATDAAKVTSPSQKVALKAPDTAAKRELVVRKPPIANVPLPVRKTYAVRLTSGKSIEALRLTWDLIKEMNRPILKGLETRFVEGPSPVGMPYRLIAGPMVTAPQARTLCSKLHKQHINCDVTVFHGRRL